MNYVTEVTITAWTRDGKLFWKSTEGVNMGVVAKKKSGTVGAPAWWVPSSILSYSEATYSTNKIQKLQKTNFLKCFQCCVERSCLQIAAFNHPAT
jgi:hypothetical protein